MQCTAFIQGQTTASTWDFGDGVVWSNQPFATHAWSRAGDYEVVLRAFNEGHPGVASVTQAVHVLVEPVHYVSATSTNPVPPYTTWTTAATNLQDAVDVVQFPGAVVMVGDGIYASGGSGANRLTVDRPMSVESLNGAQRTVIDGGGTVRCAWLADQAKLSGFTLTNGAATCGGGVWCQSSAAVVSDCVLTGNRASIGAGASGGTLSRCRLTGNETLSPDPASGGISPQGGGTACCVLNQCRLEGNSSTGPGGGAYMGTLNNCILVGNVGYRGGGTYEATLNNCTLVGNSGGGVFGGVLDNCIVYFNSPTNDTSSGSVDSSGLLDQRAVLNYCCTTPAPPKGVGSITNAPSFVDLAEATSGCKPARLVSTRATMFTSSRAPISTATPASPAARWISGPMSSRDRFGDFLRLAPELPPATQRLGGCFRHRR